MMTCRELTECLSDLVADELPGAIRLHLADCTPCVFMVESYRTTIRLARRLPPLELPSASYARLQAALAAQLAELWSPRT